MREMTETEFALKMEALGAQRGRIETAAELSHFAATHPAILLSRVAGDFAKDIVDRCQRIIAAPDVERHPDS